MGSGVSTDKSSDTNQTSARKSTSSTGSKEPDTEVGSAETYEHTCDVCKDEEKEAVQLCKQCQQHLCRQCSKSHAHSNHDESSLYAKQLVPVSYTSIRDRFLVDENEEISVICMTTSQKSGDVLVLLATPNGRFLKTLKGDGKDSKETWVGSSYVNMFIRDPRSKTAIVLADALTKSVKRCDISNPPSGKFRKLFETSMDCSGIAEFDKGFAVSMRLQAGYSLPNWQIHYLDRKGNIEKQIIYDSDNKPLFSWPGYLLSNKSRNILYVSDYQKHAIIALNTDGNVLFKYSHDDMKTPRAMDIDEEGNLYVACGENVVQIHKSGTQHRVLLKREIRQPQILSVCFSPAPRALIVGDASGIIKTFKFHPQNK